MKAANSCVWLPLQSIPTFTLMTLHKLASKGESTPCIGYKICVASGDNLGHFIPATQMCQTGQHAPQEPCRSFVLRDVICAYCNACTDLDLCRDPNLQVQIADTEPHAHAQYHSRAQCVLGATTLQSMCQSREKLLVRGATLDRVHHCPLGGLHVAE